jgi:hypothetical protein
VEIMVQQTRNDGLDAVASALAVESFPMDTTGLYYSVGDLFVDDQRGHRQALRDVLSQIEQRTFYEPLEAINAIRAAAGAPPLDAADLERLQSPEPRASAAGDRQAAVEGDDQLIDEVERNL